MVGRLPRSDADTKDGETFISLAAQSSRGRLRLSSVTGPGTAC